MTTTSAFKFGSYEHVVEQRDEWRAKCEKSEYDLAVMTGSRDGYKLINVNLGELHDARKVKLEEFELKVAELTAKCKLAEQHVQDLMFEKSALEEKLYAIAHIACTAEHK